MPKPNSPPRSLRGSTPQGRHASPTIERPSVPVSVPVAVAYHTTPHHHPHPHQHRQQQPQQQQQPRQQHTQPLPSQHHPQRLPERTHIAIAPTSTAPVPSPLYSSSASSPISSEVSTYPPIYPDRPHPSTTNNTPTVAAMAPSTATARNTALAFDLAPTSTPTGRISKAKKGKRVHGCEFPGCGKVFTRAEHKRRHELNHNPDATYHCRHAGCNKSFHRPDLLQRHQERHDLEASGAATIRRYPNQTTGISEPPPNMPVSAMASPQIPDSTPRTTAGGITIGSLVHPQSHGFATSAMPNVFSLSSVSYPSLHWNESQDSLLYASDSSPMPERYAHRPSMSSASSDTGFDVSTSPMMPASMPPTTWLPSTAPPNNLTTTMFANDDYMSSYAATPGRIPPSPMDGHDWSVIQSGLFPTTGGTGVSDTLRWDCLELYWQYFHPTFPIVHRPTFLPNHPSPLLACAMVAIGSYYDNKEDSKTYSLNLLEIATKLLRARHSITIKSRVVDLQTVVLLEILSTFCARQISVQVSTRFRALFASVKDNQRWLTTKPLAVFRTLRPNSSPADLGSAHKFFVEHETRSRILHACTVLDSQRAQLFQQSHTVRLRLAVPNSTQTFHLPCDDALWDASPIEKWAHVAQSHEYIELRNGKPLTPKKSSDLSFFQSQVINAHADQQVNSATKSQAISRSRLPPPLPEGFTNTSFNNHVAEMCKHTPIRNLLIVAGESWLLGRKVERQVEYSQAKVELRKWVDSATTTKRGVADSLVALWHALKLFKGLMGLAAPNTTGAVDASCFQTELFGTTHMIHEGWSVYLACLVCWAHGHRSKNDISTSTPLEDLKHASSTPTLSPSAFSTGAHPAYDPAHAAQEAQTYLLFTDATSPVAMRDVDQNILSRTHGLLATIRHQKIANTVMGGLMNDAAQVLFKLSEGDRRGDGKACIDF